MKSLSPTIYYRRHKVLLVLLLGLVSFTTLIVNVTIAVSDSTSLVVPEINYKKYATVVGLREGELGEDILLKIENHPGVKDVIPLGSITFKQPAWPIPYYIDLLSVPTEEIPYLMDYYEVKLKSGRMVSPNSNEIIISEEVARASGLEIGDEISEEVNPNYYFGLRVPLRLVGILESTQTGGNGLNIRLAFSSYGFFSSQEEYQRFSKSKLIISADGEKATVEEYLINEIESENIFVSTYDKLRNLYLIDWQGLIAAFGFINVVIAAGSAIIVGIVNQMAITQRLPELGMLNALGYEKKQLMRRLVKESAVVSGISWFIGVLLSFGVMYILKESLYYKNGMALNIYNFNPLWFSIPTPFIIVGLTYLRIRKIFKDFDAVSIVERGKLTLEGKKKNKTTPTPLRTSVVSSKTFYSRHKKLGLTLLASTIFTILLVTFPTFASTTMIHDMIPDLEPLRNVSMVWSTHNKNVSPKLENDIAAQQFIESIIPTKMRSIEMQIPLGDNGVARVFALYEKDIPVIMNQFGLHLKEGTLPSPGSYEIIVEESILINRNLHVGMDIHLPYFLTRLSNENPLEVKIVGVLERNDQIRGEDQLPTDKIWVGFSSLEFMENNESTMDSATSLLLVPKEGRKEEMDNWLEASVSSADHRVATHEKFLSELENEVEFRSSVFTIMEVGVTIIGSIAISVMSYIVFNQRREEYGILYALGYNRKWLIWRTIKETGALMLIAWITSVVAYFAILLFIQLFAYSPLGLSLDFLNPLPWIFTIPLPLVIILTSVGVVICMVNLLDAVSLIERRD